MLLALLLLWGPSSLHDFLFWLQSWCNITKKSTLSFHITPLAHPSKLPGLWGEDGGGGYHRGRLEKGRRYHGRRAEVTQMVQKQLRPLGRCGLALNTSAVIIQKKEKALCSEITRQITVTPLIKHKLYVFGWNIKAAECMCRRMCVCVLGGGHSSQPMRKS